MVVWAFSMPFLRRRKAKMAKRKTLDDLRNELSTNEAEGECVRTGTSQSGCIGKEI